MLSRSSVSGAYLRSTQEKQLLGHQLYCFQYVAAVVFCFYRYQLYCFQYVAADIFFFVSVVLFLVRSRCVFFSSHQFISHDGIYVEQKESIGGQILLNGKTIS